MEKFRLKILTPEGTVMDKDVRIEVIGTIADILHET